MRIGEGVAAMGDKVGTKWSKEWGETWCATVGLLISLISSYPQSLHVESTSICAATQSTSACINLRLSKPITFQRGLVGFSASAGSYAFLQLYLHSNETYPPHSSTSYILPQHLDFSPTCSTFKIGILSRSKNILSAAKQYFNFSISWL